MFGSDSAPHPKHKKECCGCAAGVFTSPIALQVLTEVFEKHGCLEKSWCLCLFKCTKIYNLTLPNKVIKLVKKNLIVTAEYKYKEEVVVPMFAGETISWSIDSIN